MLTKILFLSGILCFHGAIALAPIPHKQKLNQMLYAFTEVELKSQQEKRSEDKEEKQKKHFERKRNKLKYRYQKKLKNLEQEKARMTEIQYQNSKSMLKNECLTEQKKIDEKEKKLKAHIASKKEKSQQAQAEGNIDAQPAEDVWSINNRNTLETPCDDIVVGE